MERHRDRYQAGDLGSALRFAQLDESMFPDSEAAKGVKGEKAKLSPEAIALQQMMRGIHF